MERLYWLLPPSESRKEVHAATATCYFFFESGTSSEAAYRALLIQILYYHRDSTGLLDKFIYTMHTLSDGQPTATGDELAELLDICCQAIGNVYFVLDGVDECQDNATLIAHLLHITENSSVRLILFSRLAVSPLAKSIRTNHRLSIGLLTTKDIKLYMGRKLENLVVEGYLPEDIHVGNISDRLSRRAAGMFLWARLMISYLSSPALTICDRLDDMLEINLPEGLGAMYDKIIDLILSFDHASQKLAKSVFLWLIYAKRELTCRELEEALIVEHSKNKKNRKDRIPNFEDTILLVCVGLVERETVRESTLDLEALPFCFIHSSVQEYLSVEVGQTRQSYTMSFSARRITTPRNEANLRIAMICLQWLMFRFPAGPLSEFIDADVNSRSLHLHLPFSAYATTHWPFHLRETLHRLPASEYCDKVFLEGYDVLLNVLNDYLRMKTILLAWIEASYVLKEPPIKQELQEWCGVIFEGRGECFGVDSKISKVAVNVCDFARYLENLHRLWGTKFLHSPSCIWEEVTAFTPSRFLPQTSGTLVNSLSLPDDNARTEGSLKVIKKISQTSFDGGTISVLSIWPSRYG